MGYREGLKFKYTKLDALTALKKSVSALLGVSEDAETTLKKLGINTVFDLASSPLFIMANEIAAAANGEGVSLVSRIGHIPGSFVDSGGPSTPESLVKADIVALREIGSALANEIKNTLQIETVGDLGRWIPFRSAQLILNAAIPNYEKAEEASELVPKLGEYPTERHYYKTVVIDHVVPGETKELVSAGPIDISPTVSSDFGFKAPAVGALLTFAQSWFAQGVTLGNLLHSIALAPGESTRIAVLDWARQMKASGQENITELEQLTNNTTHNRAISEVQEAVATEVQTGFSKTSGSSTTGAGGAGLGLSLGPLTLGGSGSFGTSSSEAESFSSSAGTRNLAATMNQKVSDSTQQAASSVRDRRASIVKEVSEQEHQEVSTRIIANYNHMHALTVQYFEVIEIYRVNVQLHQVERCLFIPVKLIDFDKNTIQKYQGLLAAAALNRHIRELLATELGSVMIEPTLPLKRFDTLFDRVSGLDRISIASKNAARNVLRATSLRRTATLSEEEKNTPTPPTNPPDLTDTAIPMTVSSVSQPLSWMKEELTRASRITYCNITKPGKNNIFLPGETDLTGITFALTAQQNTPVSLTAVQITLHSGSTVTLTSTSMLEWDLPTAIPIQEINQVTVSASNTNYFTGKMTLQLAYGSAKFPITLPIEIRPNALQQQLCRFVPNDTSAELRIHLEQHRLHYSKAIWKGLDSASIALLLSPYTFEGKPVVDLIDPNPIMVAGNYLVFRMPSFIASIGVEENETKEETDRNSARKNWKTWLKDRGLELGSSTAVEQLVPIPTGGVFAEAVLGRSNSAERLDATRFWNWQDSPIPLQPPEIAAIQMDSRSQPVDVTPGHLGSPVVNIMNPTSLPDPAGVGAVLGAVQNGNMFRDMAGLAATAGLAQTLAGHATSAGTEAGRQAAANLAVAAQKDIEEKRIAAQLALAAMGIPTANTGTPKNISESGALLNTASEMDKQSPRGDNSSGGMNGAGTLPDSDDSSMEGGGSDDGSFDGSYMPGVDEGLMDSLGGGSRADEVLSKMTWGNLGTAGVNIIPAGRKKTRSSTATTLLFELATYATFPRPWPDEATEVQGILDDKWLPAEEDFDAISPAATQAINGGTKPYGGVMKSINDVISTITYFAPTVPGFGTSRPARVIRINLFLYADTYHLAFTGTLNTSGAWGATTGSDDINAPVVDKSVLNKIRTNASNKSILSKLKKAWRPGAEIWVYTSGGVANDALLKALAKLMGAKVRAFTEPFWVLPEYDATQKTILARDAFGIGSDFNSAWNTRTNTLHNLDSLATRTFKP